LTSQYDRITSRSWKVLKKIPTPNRHGAGPTMSPDPLNTNIKLFFPEGSPNNQLALSRVSFSAGTVEAVSSGLPYAKHARIPVFKVEAPNAS
jgi:hypothetical protein